MNNSTSFDHCRAYLLAHAAAYQEQETHPSPCAVTFSRQTGAGAITVGRLLAEFLEMEQGGDERYPWAVFDRNLVQKVLKDNSLPQSLAPHMPEDARSRLDEFFEELFGVHPAISTLVQHTNHTILRLASVGNVVLVGRGAHLVTAHLRHAFHVRLVAPLAFRTAHIAAYYHMSKEEAAAYIEKKDSARVRYLRRHFKAPLYDPLQFHLTINTGRISFGDAARVIGEAVLRHHRPQAAECGARSPHKEFNI